MLTSCLHLLGGPIALLAPSATSGMREPIPRAPAHFILPPLVPIAVDAQVALTARTARRSYIVVRVLGQGAAPLAGFTVAPTRVHNSG